jgi:hypothetical protein
MSTSHSNKLLDYHQSISSNWSRMALEQLATSVLEHDGLLARVRQAGYSILYQQTWNEDGSIRSFIILLATGETAVELGRTSDRATMTSIRESLHDLITQVLAQLQLLIP